VTGYTVYLASINVILASQSPAPNSYLIDASTAADVSGTVFSNSALGSATSLALSGLAQNVTYYFRLGASNASSTTYTSILSTVTLAATPTALSFSSITGAQFTVGWGANSNPAGTLYQVEVATTVGFGTLTTSLSTTSLTATFAPLSQNTTYFVRVSALNFGFVRSGYSLGAVLTAVGVITLSANRLPSVWYNTTSSVFNAQGAVTYHYRISSSQSDLATLSDPTFDGSALTVTLLTGISYFHVLGLDGSALPVGTATFGPLQSDGGIPVIPALSAQKSSTDPTAINHRHAPAHSHLHLP
jgi:hypothetical protein